MNHQTPRTTQSTKVQYLTCDIWDQLTGVCQTQSKVVAERIPLKGKENGEIDDERQEVSDVGMRCRDTADVVPLHTFDLVVFCLADFTFF